MKKPNNYYLLLGLDASATSAQIKAAYRKLASKYHPDKGGDPEIMKAINEAYRTLSNVIMKDQYDYMHRLGKYAQNTQNSSSKAAPKSGTTKKTQKSSSTQQTTPPPRPGPKRDDFDAHGVCKTCDGSGVLRIGAKFSCTIITCTKCYGIGTWGGKAA